MSNLKTVAEYIAATHSISKKSAEEILTDAFAFIKDELKNGNPVDVRGFGKFGVAFRPERKGRNPATGADITIPAKFSPNFKPAKALKDEINP